MNCALAFVTGGRPVKLVSDCLGVAHSHLGTRSKRAADWHDARQHRRPDDAELVADLKTLIRDLPSYGYHRPGNYCGASEKPSLNDRSMPSGSIGS